MYIYKRAHEVNPTHEGWLEAMRGALPRKDPHGSFRSTDKKAWKLPCRDGRGVYGQKKSLEGEAPESLRVGQGRTEHAGTEGSSVGGGAGVGAVVGTAGTVRQRRRGKEVETYT